MMLADAEGKPAFTHGVMLDITERREAEERLTYLAYHDNLTGMPNRAMFDELLELSLARARRADRGVAVLALDIDNFKLVNDSLGHEAGDRLILQVALRLQDATRDTDLVARSGGDEFLMLLADLDQASPVNDENGGAHHRPGGREPRPAGVRGPLRGRRHRAVRDRLDRHQRVPAGRGRRREPDAQRRQRDLPGEGRRTRRLRAEPPRERGRA